MTVALCLLGAGCVAFGIFPGWMLGHVAAPAAASLLHGSSYSHGVLAGGVALAPLHVNFVYFKPQELVTVAATVVLGLGLARAYMRIREPAPIALLRALHTGSVNDYAAFWVVGVLAALAVLAT